VTNEISKYDDVIDSRDVIERISDLLDCMPELDADESAELKALQRLAEQGSCSPDWHHGELLIRESYFVEYAQELAEDCAMVSESQRWPNYCIDWDWAARDLMADYMNVDFGGVPYLIRA